jgi:uncharacterized protein (TIGR00369 family)
LTSDLRVGAGPSAGQGSFETKRPGSAEVRPGSGPIYEFEPHNCFACGELNEHGLQLKLHLGERRSWTDFVLEDRFEGWVGVTHGGIIATILDEVMAWALVAEDNWGVTARMSIQFKKPIPVGTRVHGEGWVVRSRRRLVDTAGQISDPEGTILATSEATYLAAPPERKRELMAQYGVRIRNARMSGEGISK